MTSARSTLLLPVENQVRELDAKLLLACAAAERGFHTVLGSRGPLHFALGSLPRGVYLAKSMRALSERVFGILRDLGHEIVSWDEEALVTLNAEYYHGRRLSPRTLEQASALIAWGPESAAMLRSYEGFPRVDPPEVYEAGNPRIDMLRPELRGYFADEIDRLRRRFGRFLLVNTNFGWNNHYLPRMRLDQPEGAPTNAFEEGLAKHKSALFHGFLEMVPALARAFPELHVVVRPHPVEDPARWEQAASGRSNVSVSNEGNVAPWLMACEALVHVGCTTAVEAAVIGTPVLAYQVAEDERFDDPLPKAVSLGCGTLEALLDAVRSVSQGQLADPGRAARGGLLAQHIAALDGELASDRIVSVLLGMGYGDRLPPRPALPRTVRGWLHNAGRTRWKRLQGRRAGHRSSVQYHDHRFPPLSVDALRERAARLGRELGRFDSLRIEARAEHLFDVRPG